MAASPQCSPNSAVRPLLGHNKGLGHNQAALKKQSFFLLTEQEWVQMQTMRDIIPPNSVLLC